MTLLAVNFPGPDSHDAWQTLIAALANFARVLGGAPRFGLLLKTKMASDGEIVSCWDLVDLNKISRPPSQDSPSTPISFNGFPSTGVILKIREDDSGERLVNWMLTDPSQIEMLVVGLSIDASMKKAQQGVHIS